MQVWYFGAHMPQVHSVYSGWRHLGSFALGDRLSFALLSAPKVPAGSLVDATEARQKTSKACGQLFKEIQIA
jgi:hypothetical protein